MPTLTIGEIARQAQVNASAIRFYEREGVLPEPHRKNGRGHYDAETILQRLAIIDVSKRAGFSLNDVKSLFQATDAGAPAHAELRALAQVHLPQVEALIEQATDVKRWLEASANCTCESLGDCSLFGPHQSLSADCSCD